ncbi:hypothetical protein Bhyg_09537, partial [Pseudolycoriella hygida]
MGSLTKSLCIAFAVAILISLQLIEATNFATTVGHTYCNLENMNKYCPPCPRVCYSNKCGCTCPITKEKILPRPSNPQRPVYCASCPLCLQFKEKCPDILPLCTADSIRDLIAL